MASTKKRLEEELDYTSQPQAKTQEDVDAQDTRTRLWQSLGYSYQNQMRDSDKAYDKAISQTDRQLQSRGLGRSSYNAQTLGNLRSQQADARNRIGEAWIADYQSRIGQLEQQDAENERWEREFAEKQRQYDTSLEFQRSENALNRAFQTSEREAGQAYNTGEREAQQGWQSGENALNRAFTTSEREAQQAYNTGERQAQQNWQSSENALNRAFTTSERQAQQAYNTAERIAQQGYNTSEREATQAWQAGQTAQQQAWQSGENALNRQLTQEQMAYQQNRDTIEDAFRERQYADSRYDTAFSQNMAERQLANEEAKTEWQQAMAEIQYKNQLEQWKEEFDYTKMTNDQKLAFEVIGQAASLGNDVSDDILKRAGISRADFNAMKIQAQATGGGRNNNKGNQVGDVLGGPELDRLAEEALMHELSGFNDVSSQIYQWASDSAKVTYQPTDIATTTDQRDLKNRKNYSR